MVNKDIVYNKHSHKERNYLLFTFYIGPIEQIILSPMLKKP